jgi:ribose/xylose/arabinose/galactoside ABC-type transport system permease subunit
MSVEMTKDKKIQEKSDRINRKEIMDERWTFKKFFSKVNVILILVVLIIIFTVINQRFFTFQNFQFVLKQSSILLIAAIGGTFIILMGSIDLSVGGVASLTCVASAIFANYHVDYPFAGGLVIIECIVIGMAFGLINGFILVKGKIPSFLVTLGIGTIAGGIALLLTGGFTVPTFTPSFRWLGVGSVLGIPALGIGAAIIYIVGIFISNSTRLGKYVFAIGGGEQATRFSGVSVDKIKLITFAIAGAFYGLSGSLLAARIGAGSSKAGEGLVLDVIAAVVMSGTSLTGGVGSPARTILGVLIITVLGNGLNIIGVSPHVQVVIKGIIVILAVFTTIDRSRVVIMK